MPNDLTFTARWIFPVDREPLPRGIITIEGSCIVAVEPAGARGADVDFGNAALVPGFVNAHTHLDLSDSAGKFPPTSDFTAWLKQVIGHRRQQTPEHIRGAISIGIRESQRFGVTALGDISAQGESWNALAAAPLDAVVYHEAIGLSQERGAACFKRVRDWFESCPALPHCRPGISPHAPYTVGRSLFKKLIEYRTETLAAGIQMPLAIHLAETRDEIELLMNRSGCFVAFLQEMGVYDADALTNDFDAWFACADAAFIHANYADPKSLARSAPRAIVYCPRTHRAFGHSAYPLREFLDAGMTVALGTDSLASNPDLNVLAEARLVSELFPDIAGSTVLRMLTANGAAALGGDFAKRTGTLSTGKDATFVVLPLPNRDEADSHRLLFDSDQIAARVLVRGEWRLPDDS